MGNKPIVYVLNKKDLVNHLDLVKWVNYFKNQENGYVVSSNATSTGAGKEIIKILHNALQGKIDFYKNKGANITVRAMIIGVPNCGKSTLANILCGKAKAITGNKAGVTKGKQWLKVSPYVEVLDTPGTLWPDLANETVAQNLAFIGSIKDEVLEKNDLAFSLVEKVMEIDAQSLVERYGIQIGDTPLQTLDNIALKKGFKMKGGEVDYDRVCIMVLLDYKNGKLTKRILDNLVGD